jgi:hypothetical protein
MLSLVAGVIGYVALCCLALLAPTYLLARLGFAKMSLVVGSVTAAALTTDYLYNWERLSYPHALLGGPTHLFPLTILVAIGAIAIGVRACLEQL